MSSDLMVLLWDAIQRAYNEIGSIDSGIAIVLREDGSGAITDVRTKKALYDFDTLAEFTSRWSRCMCCDGEVEAGFVHWDRATQDLFYEAAYEMKGSGQVCSVKCWGVVMEGFYDQGDY